MMSSVTRECAGSTAIMLAVALNILYSNKLIAFPDTKFNNTVVFCHRASRDHVMSSRLIALAGIFTNTLKLKEVPNICTCLGKYVVINSLIYLFGVEDIYRHPFLTGCCIWLLVMTVNVNEDLISLESATSTWVMLPGLLSVFIIWASSALYLLDWAEEWQQWPIPTIYAAVFATFLSSLLKIIQKIVS